MKNSKIFLKMYLYRNLGDDLFLKIICVRYPNAVFYTNADKKHLKPLYLRNVKGIGAILRIFQKVSSALGGKQEQLAHGDASILLGGSMFIERGLERAKLVDYIKQRYDLQKPLYIIGANFGPFVNDYYLYEYEQVFLKAEDVCFRERYSANLFNGKLDNVRVAPDIVFGLDRERFRIAKNKKVVISVINLESRGELAQYMDCYEGVIARISREYVKRGYEVVLMSFCKAEGDERAIKRICDRVSDNRVKKFYYRGNIDEAVNEISSSEIIIGTRFHAIVLGLVFEKNVLPIVYSNKTKNMLNDIGYKGKMVDVANIGSVNVSEMDKYLFNYGSIEKLAIDSNRHFEKLDLFMKENN